MEDIEVVAERDGAALARHIGHEQAKAVGEAANDPFEPDPDPRPLPVPVHAYALVVLHDGEIAGGVSWLPMLHGPTCSDPTSTDGHPQPINQRQINPRR